jgi:hypothetical protein
VDAPLPLDGDAAPAAGLPPELLVIWKHVLIVPAVGGKMPTALVESDKGIFWQNLVHFCKIC